jgi:hypothetical protein
MIWYSTPSGYHSFHINGSSFFYIGDTSASITGRFNEITGFQEAGTNISIKVLPATITSTTYQQIL